MAELTHFYAEGNSVQTSSTTASWQDVDTTNGRISGSSLSANTKYLVVARAIIRSNSGTSHGYFRVDITDDATVTAKSETRIEFRRVGATEGKAWGFVHSFTTDASPGDIDLQYYADSTATASMDQYTLLVIDLDELGTDNYKENIDNTSSGELSTTSWGTTLANISGATLGTTNHWLLLGCARISVGSTTLNHNVGLFGANVGSSQTLMASYDEEGEDLNEERMHLLFGHHSATSNTAAAIKAYEDSASANAHRNGSYLIAINTGHFKDFDYDFTAGTATVSGETTVATVTVNPGTAGNHMVFGTATKVATTNMGQLHLEDGTTETRTGDSALYQTNAWDTVKDEEAALTMQRINMSTGSNTYNLRADVMANGAKLRGLYILNLNLNSATITGAASVDGTGGVSATGVRTRLGVASVDGTGALTVSGTRTTFGTASVDGIGAVAADAFIGHFGDAVIAGVGGVDAVGTRFLFGEASVDGVGGVTAAGGVVIFGAGSVDGVGGVAAAGGVVIFGVASVDGTGGITVIGDVSIMGSATIAGTGGLRAVGTVDTRTPPVDPYDASLNSTYGGWFRHSSGTVTFAYGSGRGKFEGLSDWERVSPLIKFNLVGQQVLEDYVWPIIFYDNNGNDADTTSAAVTAALTGLYPLLEYTP